MHKQRNNMSLSFLTRTIQAVGALFVALSMLGGFGLIRFIFWLGEPGKVLEHNPGEKLAIIIFTILLIVLANTAFTLMIFALNPLRKTGFGGARHKLLITSSSIYAATALVVALLWIYLKIANPSGNVLIPLSGIAGSIIAILALGLAAVPQLLISKISEAHDLELDSKLTV